MPLKMLQKKRLPMSSRNLKAVSLFVILPMLLSSCFLTILPFSGGTGKLKLYTYEEYSKKELNNAIQCFYKKHPQYIPPQKYKNTMIHYYSDLSDPESRRVNADTVQVHFYVKTNEGDEILYWTVFTGLQKEWMSKSTKLALVGYKKKSEKLLIYEDFKNERVIKKDINIKIFESEILPKIKENLGKGKCD